MDLLAVVLVVAAVALLFAWWIARHALPTPRTSAVLRPATLREGAKEHAAWVAGALAAVGVVLVAAFASRALQPFDLARRRASLVAWELASFATGATTTAVSISVCARNARRGDAIDALDVLVGRRRTLPALLHAGLAEALVVLASSVAGLATVSLVALRVYGGDPDVAANASRLAGAFLVGAVVVGAIAPRTSDDRARWRAADLARTAAAESVAAMLIGAALFRANAPVFRASGAATTGIVVFPLLMRGFGMLASAVGVLSVRGAPREGAADSATRGLFVTGALVLLGVGASCFWLLGGMFRWFAVSGAIGVGLAYALVLVGRYFYEAPYAPACRRAEASERSADAGVRVGAATSLEGAAIAVAVTSVALFAAYECGEWSGLAEGGLFAVAVCVMGAFAGAGYFHAVGAAAAARDLVESRRGEDRSGDDVAEVEPLRGATVWTSVYGAGATAMTTTTLFAAFLEEALTHRAAARWAVVKAMGEAGDRALARMGVDAATVSRWRLEDVVAHVKQTHEAFGGDGAGRLWVLLGALGGAALAAAVTARALENTLDGGAARALVVFAAFATPLIVAIAARIALGRDAEAVAALVLGAAAAGVLIVFREALDVGRRAESAGSVVSSALTLLLASAVVVAPLAALR